MAEADPHLTFNPNTATAEAIVLFLRLNIPGFRITRDVKHSWTSVLIPSALGGETVIGSASTKLGALREAAHRVKLFGAEALRRAW